MDTTDWIALGQLITAVLGIIGVIVTLRLNTRAVRLSAQTLGLNAAARTAVEASKYTGDILPRVAYELAGAPVPANATDVLQPNPGGPGAPWEHRD